MPILNPGETVQAANEIYNILDPQAQFYRRFPTSLNDNFQHASGTKMTGKTGSRILQSTTGFALAVRGKSMAHQDDEYINSKK